MRRAIGMTPPKEVMPRIREAHEKLALGGRGAVSAGMSGEMADADMKRNVAVRHADGKRRSGGIDGKSADYPRRRALSNLQRSKMKAP